MVNGNVSFSQVSEEDNSVSRKAMKEVLTRAIEEAIRLFQENG